MLYFCEKYVALNNHYRNLHLFFQGYNKYISTPFLLLLQIVHSRNWIVKLKTLIYFQHEAVQVTKCNEILSGNQPLWEQNFTSATVTAAIIMDNDVIERIRTVNTQHCNKAVNVISFIDIFHWEDYEDSSDRFFNDSSFWEKPLKPSL